MTTQVPITRPDDGGLLLVGHGTRDVVGRAEFGLLAKKISAMRPNWRLEACFLELADPGIAAGLDTLTLRGARQVTVQPLLLFAAGHAKSDIPRAVEIAAAKHRELSIQFAAALGCQEQLLALSAARFAESLVDRPAVPWSETALILVGRGSRDAEATAEMHRFAQARRQATPLAALEVCFAAMAEPTLTETLVRAARLGCRRIIVQPHLLFAGELLSGVRATVAEAAQRDPQHQWLLAAHLGPDDRLATAVIENVEKISVPRENWPCPTSV